MTILGIALAIMVALTFLVGLPMGTWHMFHVIRRRHRLENQADAREYARVLAEDFARITKELSDGSLMNYDDYLRPELEQLRSPALVKARLKEIKGE